MKIKVTSVYVDDQDKALRFYTDVLGFVKKNDFSQGPYRWLTVASAEEPNGTEPQLTLKTIPYIVGNLNLRRKTEVPPGNPGHRRERVPIEVILQHPGLILRRPSGCL